MRLIIVQDVQDAIRVLREGNSLVNVAVIICDIRMPKMNGVEYIDYLLEQAPGIPVIVLTEYPDPEMANTMIE